tara:strand:- start:272 stop:490 length:219 start_codon:yes stop_codon:yes gene_type:complete
MNIYPNPSLGIFNLSFNDNKKHNIEITNLSGKQFLYVEDIISDYKFDFSKLPAGSYFINVLPENIKYQIIKQ